MDAKTCALCHFLVLVGLSVGILPRRRLTTIVLLFLIPILGEIVQFFMPTRTPDLMDVYYGYLGILAGYCLVQLWREIEPAVKKAQLHLKNKVV